MIVSDCLQARRAARTASKQNLVVAQGAEDDLAAAPADESPDSGMTTAEYAVGTIAACTFAAVLYKVVTSAAILSLLSGVVTRALHVPF
jgi:uncharacterized protein DUF4244